MSGDNGEQFGLFRGGMEQGSNLAPFPGGIQACGRAGVRVCVRARARAFADARVRASGGGGGGGVGVRAAVACHVAA